MQDAIDSCRSGRCGPDTKAPFSAPASELGAPNAATFARALATVPQGDPANFLRSGLSGAR